MFLLDMLLGNADRLPCSELSWRGNPGNVLFGSGQGKYGARLVAIDSAVQRRPPALRSSADDERTERLAQLLLHSRDTAVAVLRQVGTVLWRRCTAGAATGRVVVLGAAEQQAWF